VSERVSRTPSTSRYAPVIGFCAAVRAGDHVYVSGVTAVAPDGSVVGESDPGAQTAECLRKIEQTLARIGAALPQIVSTRMYLVDAAHWQAVGEAHGAAFRETPPAATMVVVKALLDERMLVEIEAVAYLG
jgi:enamine deaminase RidA (YjgF/YER057c/UK114 family)